MEDAGNDLRIAVLGDSSATLYIQDRAERARAQAALAWPQLLSSRDLGRPVAVASFAGVGQRLDDGLAGPYQGLDTFRPDVVVVSHGGREGIVALPRALAWLRCYAHDEAPYRGSHRLRHRLGRPIWSTLVAAITRWPRLMRIALWPLNIHAVQRDTRRYRAHLEQLVRHLVDDQGAHVVLMTTFIARQSYWPVFFDILAANDATAKEIAAAFPDRVSVLALMPDLTEQDFTADGAHLTPEGHRRAAHIVAAHLRQVTCTSSRRVPAQPRRTRAAVA